MALDTLGGIIQSLYILRYGREDFEMYGKHMALRQRPKFIGQFAFNMHMKQH